VGIAEEIAKLSLGERVAEEVGEDRESQQCLILSVVVMTGTVMAVAYRPMRLTCIERTCDP